MMTPPRQTWWELLNQPNPEWNSGSADTVSDAIPLEMTVSLSSGAGQSCACRTRAVISAFLAFARVGLLPHPGLSWEAKVAGHDAPDFGDRDSALHEFQGLGANEDDEVVNADDGLFAVFESGDAAALITRWTIVATLLLLIQTGHLPALSTSWSADLKRMFDAVHNSEPLEAPGRDTDG